MGFAPYDQPVYTEAIRKHLIDIKPDGSFWLNMDYFHYGHGLAMTGPRFHRLFGAPPSTGIAARAAAYGSGREHSGSDRGDRSSHGARPAKVPVHSSQKKTAKLAQLAR
jgi:predicted NodU family carbamoyl transferase